MVGGAIPEQVVLGFIRGWVEQAMEINSKQFFSMATVSAPASGIPACLSSCPGVLQ